MKQCDECGETIAPGYREGWRIESYAQVAIKRFCGEKCRASYWRREKRAQARLNPPASKVMAQALENRALMCGYDEQVRGSRGRKWLWDHNRGEAKR